jgi:transposase-like protein
MIEMTSKKPSMNGIGQVERPNPEVQTRPAKAQRRTFSPAYKRAVVAEAEKCVESGTIGALLRREGLFSSHLSQWRKQAEAGELKGIAHPRGRKATAQKGELAQLRQENSHLRSQLEQAELIIGAQKKLAQAFENVLSQAKDGQL